MYNHQNYLSLSVLIDWRTDINIVVNVYTLCEVWFDDNKASLATFFLM